MISGLNSSSLSLALRTAQRAEQTVAKTTQQIATGKKVASVKDDGAAYTRTAALKSDKKTSESRDFMISRLEVGLSHMDHMLSINIETQNKLSELIIAARALDAGSDARKALQVEWNQVTEWAVPALTLGNPANTRIGVTLVDNGMDVGSDFSTPDTFFGNGLWADGGGFWDFAANPGGLPVTLRGFDLINASNAQFNSAEYTIGEYRRDARNRWAVSVANDQNRLELLKRTNSKTSDRLDSAISSLTNADMGKVSRENELAQTRQQLAYQTVRNAITQYGNMASGLLGNVQQTQRGIRA